MPPRVLRVALLLAAIATPAAAQNHGAAAPPVATRAPREASQFDFLVGQWELVVKPRPTSLAQRIHGVRTLAGTWKAWRAMEGWGIEDELRVVDASGNPLALTHALRVYEASTRRWKSTAVDPYRGLVTSSMAQWRDDAMHATAEGTDQEGRAFRSRTRFHDITPTSFRYTQDRSYDGGKSWTEGYLTMEAKRTGATAPR